MFVCVCVREGCSLRVCARPVCVLSSKKTRCVFRCAETSRGCLLLLLCKLGNMSAAVPGGWGEKSFSLQILNIDLLFLNTRNTKEGLKTAAYTHKDFSDGPLRSMSGVN